MSHRVESTPAITDPSFLAPEDPPSAWADILGKAQAAVSDRPASYGSPFENYQRWAGMLNAMFDHKLSTHFTAADCAMMMAALKIARQVHTPKPDNLVDLAGYAEVAAQIQEYMESGR